MFHVFRVLPPDFSRNFSKSQSLKFLKFQGLRLARRFALFSPRAHIGTGGEAQNFPSPRAHMGRARNFFKFHGLYTGRKIYNDWHLASLSQFPGRNISSYADFSFYFLFSLSFSVFFTVCEHFIPVLFIWRVYKQTQLRKMYREAVHPASFITRMRKKW